MFPMDEITPLVLRYREAARTVWNGFLREEPWSSPVTHDWEALKQVLFTALVLRRCGHDDCAAALLGPDRYGFSWVEPLFHLHVVPTTEVPVMISRTPSGGTYWDHAVDRLGAEDADLRYIDFFDFDQLGYLDFRYYLVHIESSARHPALAGHQALVDVAHAKVFAESASASATASG
jgi:hypothetical protein